MKWTWVVVLLVVASTTGAAIQTDESECPVEVGASDEPGQELANVVGAQESVVAREIERRGFNATLANASSPDERATVIATELERIDLRLATLESCQDALVTAYEDGDLTAEEYRQRAGTLESDVVDARERLDRAADAAGDLSSEVRADADIGEDRFEALTTRVSDLETFVASPDRAIESADEDPTALTESTSADSNDDDGIEPRTTTQEDDTPDETTTTEPPTATPTATPTPTPEPETPTEPAPTTEPDPTETDGVDETTSDESGGESDDESGFSGLAVERP